MFKKWKKNLRSIPLILVMFLLLAYSSVELPNDYVAEVDTWHKSRVEGLKKENGWLNLVGLYWLKEGKNSFGSDQSNDLVFPNGSIPAVAGYLELSGNIVTLVTEKNVAVTVNKQPVSSYILFHKDSARAPVAAYGSLRWTVISRDDKTGVRLRDLNSAALASFKGIDRFPVDPSWKVEATLQSVGQPDRISITNVLGQTNLQKSAGKLVFTINNKVHSLDALDEGEELFILFADPTNTSSTYPSGRFIYVKKPDASGRTIIDFNKAYNPPCAFTEYATCPLPPKQNVLPLAVTAGEKKYEGIH